MPSSPNAAEAEAVGRCARARMCLVGVEGKGFCSLNIAMRRELQEACW